MKRGLSKNQRILLLEAARRYVRFHMGEPITQAWTGLGSASAYKPVYDAGYMKPVGALTPRAVNWWRLTAKGAAIVKVLTSSMTLSEIEKEAGW